MNNTPPIALLVMFAVAAVGAVVIFFTLGPGRGAKPTRSGHARLQVVGSDGAPRAGVRLIVRRNAAARAIVLPVSGADGGVEVALPVGRYEVQVYPKKLSTVAQREAFLVERKLEFRDLEQFRFPVGSLVIAADEEREARFTLPAQTAY